MYMLTERYPAAELVLKVDTCLRTLVSGRLNLPLNLVEKCKRRCFQLSVKRENTRQHWNLRIQCPFIEIKRSEYWPILPFKTEVEVRENFTHYMSRVVWNNYFSWKQKVDQFSFYPSYACFRLATVLTRWQWELKESFLYIFQIVHR